MKEYIIPFVGLEFGDHHFDFDINSEFFKEFEDSEIQTSNLKLDFHLLKEERMLTLTFNFSGMVGLLCDRCLELIDYDLNIDNILFIKFGEAFSEESEDLIIIPESDHEIDISSFIYEFVLLSLPFKKVHPMDENGKSTCSSEMLKKLEEFNKNNNIDPRWEKLNELKKKSN